jgi:Domain of unknown function (DUF4062)
MALPRIFISSTHYDLKHMRAALGTFIQSLGYEAILSENGNIPYLPDGTPAESCYDEAASADIFVLVLGGRYGSSSSKSKTKPSSFYERYESITKGEYEAATRRNVPTYILIDREVYSDFQTFQKNPKSRKVKYAHVESVNIFYFIDSILAQKGSNPVKEFSTFSDVEDWLKRQWAGLFQNLLERRSTQPGLNALSAQVNELQALNRSFKTYLETIVTQIIPKASRTIIANEDAKLRELDGYRKFVADPFSSKLSKLTAKPLEALYDIIRTTNSSGEFTSQAFESEGRRDVFLALMTPGDEMFIRLNEIRIAIGLEPFIENQSTK